MRENLWRNSQREARHTFVKRDFCYEPKEPPVHTHPDVPAKPELNPRAPTTQATHVNLHSKKAKPAGPRPAHPSPPVIRGVPNQQEGRGWGCREISRSAPPGQHRPPKAKPRIAGPRFRDALNHAPAHFRLAPLAVLPRRPFARSVLATPPPPPPPNTVTLSPPAPKPPIRQQLTHLNQKRHPYVSPANPPNQQQIPTVRKNFS